MPSKILQGEDEDSYKKFLKNNTLPFEYDLKWAKILCENFKFKRRYIISKDDSGEIDGVLPFFLTKGFSKKGLVASPYSIHAGIFATKKEVKTQIIEFAKNLVNQSEADYFEIRERKQQNYYGCKENKRVFNFSLKLSNKEDLWKKMPKGSVRWGVKKAKKEGLTYKCGNSKELVDTFYDLFLSTRKHRGVPAYPKKYFKDIITNFGKDVKIYVSYKNDKALAAIFLIYYNEEVRYLAAGAVYDRELLKHQPYHLIMWQAIEDAIDDGKKRFNLGGATASTNDGGLYSFKKRWSDTIEEVPYYFYPNNINLNNAESPLFKIASKVWRHLPTSIIKTISPMIIRRFN